MVHLPERIPNPGNIILVLIAFKNPSLVSGALGKLSAVPGMVRFRRGSAPPDPPPEALGAFGPDAASAPHGAGVAANFG